MDSLSDRKRNSKWKTKEEERFITKNHENSNWQQFALIFAQIGMKSAFNI